MRINVFEGARRIALLLSIVAALVVVGITFADAPYIVRHYAVAAPGAPFVTVGECGNNEVTAFGPEVKTPSGTEVSIYFCLPSSPDQYGAALIAVAPDRVAYQYSNEAEAYKKQLGTRFVLPSADAAGIDEQAGSMKRKQWLMSVGGLAIGLAIFWTLVWSIGWIVRGFAGIPRGQDSRPRE